MNETGVLGGHLLERAGVAREPQALDDVGALGDGYDASDLLDNE